MYNLGRYSKRCFVYGVNGPFKIVLIVFDSFLPEGTFTVVFEGKVFLQEEMDGGELCILHYHRFLTSVLCIRSCSPHLQYLPYSVSMMCLRGVN
ncbi:hypothetical protein XELAEV_18002692mg [Xenopus laevis]|nr:hypothetical protein XELAEV_18002692mg [Xenopus laevis]